MKSLTASGIRVILAAGLLLASVASAQTNSPLPGPNLPDVGASVLRMFGALVLVLALFLGGLWLFRQTQRTLGLRGRAPKLRVVEARSLGHRSALYVVGYEQQRLLVAASPTGITLLTQLPSAPESEPEPIRTAPSFARTLQQMLGSS